MLPEIKPYLTALALPPLSPLLLIAVAWWGLKRHRAWAHAAIALGLASLWLLSCSAVSVWLSRHLLPQHPMVNVQDFKTQQVQALVVLGGGVEVDLPDGVAQLGRHSLDRLRQGVQWARVTHLPLMFTSGVGWGGRKDGPTEAEVAQRVAQDAVDWPLRWAESQSRDTQESSPIPNESRKKQLRGDWRTEMLHKKLREPRYRDGALLLVPMHNLTFDQWDMHIARTRPEHARPLPNTSVDERLAAVCDCTHFCHKPQFWSGAFFPALRAALLKGEQREAEQLRGRTAAPALWR